MTAEENRAAARRWLEEELIAPLTDKQIASCCDHCGSMPASLVTERSARALMAAIRAKGEADALLTYDHQCMTYAELCNCEGAIRDIIRASADDVPEPPR